MHETHFVRDRQSWVGGFAACISSNHFLCRRPARIQPARLPPNHRLLRWVGPRGGNTHGSRLRRRWGPLGRWRTGECKPKSPEHSHAARVTSPPNVSAVSAILPNYKPNYIRGYERLVHGRGGEKGSFFTAIAIKTSRPKRNASVTSSHEAPLLAPLSRSTEP